jgi:TolA-binding protein
MNGRIAFLIVLALLLPIGASAQTAGDDAASNTSALLTRHQQRMDILEQGLKEIRGVVEKDLRTLRLKVEELGTKSSESGTAQSSDIKALRAEMEKLNDMLAMTNRRMERTLEIASDTEFRLLRLEKRVQTLISLGGADAAAAAVQQDATAAEAPANVQMSREASSGVTTWSVEEGALNRELDAISSKDPEAAAASDATPASTADAAAPAAAVGTESAAASVAQPAAPPVPAQPKVLPALAPEEQYRFALGRAMQNDLEVAARAFAEFRQFNAGHAREVDATYWLGRVQFMRGEYEKAALTFTEFNSAYPGDDRLVDTTMWIAESVSHFAPPDQACAIYADLPQLLDSPPEAFMKKLAELSDAAKCKG